MRIVGYPTLYFFAGGDKGNPIEYDGDRSAEAIVDFVQSFRTAYTAVEEGAGFCDRGRYGYRNGGV